MVAALASSCYSASMAALGHCCPGLRPHPPPPSLHQSFHVTTYDMHQSVYSALLQCIVLPSLPNMLRNFHTGAFLPVFGVHVAYSQLDFTEVLCSCDLWDTVVRLLHKLDLRPMRVRLITNS